MKIAVWHNLPSGGGKRALYYHIKGLVERGHQVEVWSPPLVDESYLPLAGLVQEHVVPLEWADPKRKTAWQKLHNKLCYFQNQMQAMEEHCRKCAEQINGRGFDIFFGNTCLNLRVSPMGRYISIPKVLYLQEPFRWLYEALPELPWATLDLPEKFLWKPLEWKLLLEDFVRILNKRLQVREELSSVRAYDMVLANSYFSRESMIRAYGIIPKVCYLGVDTELFVAQGRKRKNIIAGIGSFDYIKNIDFVIRSVSCLPDLNPTLVWIGNSSDPGYLNGLSVLARELGVDFQPMQMVTDERMVEILNEATALAYAPHLEPFGYAPLEANSCGLPVVAIAEGGVRETVMDGVTGLLLEPDEKAMAAGLRRLLEDEAFASTLGRQGRKVVIEKWALAAAIDRLETRLYEVLEGRRRKQF